MAINESVTFGSVGELDLSFSFTQALNLNTEPQQPQQPQQQPRRRLPRSTPLSNELFGQPQQPEFQPPVALTFEFVAPKVFWPTPAVEDWLEDLPAAKKVPLSPAPVPGDKRRMDQLTSREFNSGADDEAAHGRARKRAKFSFSRRGSGPSSTQGSAGTKRSGRDVLRRMSGACMRAMLGSKAPRGLLDSDRGAFPPFETRRPHFKFLVVGDTKCGKSSLLYRYARGMFTAVHRPTTFECFTKETAMDIEVEMWDTAGDIGLQQLEKLTYLKFDVVLVCFSLTSQRSFDAAQNEWIGEVRKHCTGNGKPLVFLVGLKKDERSLSPGLTTPFFGGARISASEGSMAAAKIGAARYFECSAKTGEGVDDLFDKTVEATVIKQVESDQEAW